MAVDPATLPFADLIDAAPDGLVVIDRAGVIVLINAEGERMFGYGRGELPGRPIEILVPDRVRSDHPHHVARFHADPRLRPMGSNLDLRGRRRDGREFSVEVSLSPIRHRGETLVVAGVRDLSDRRRIEGEARRAAADLASAVETIQDAFALFDEDDRVVMVNSAARRLFGDVLGDAIVGRPFAEVLGTALASGVFELSEDSRGELYRRWSAYHRAPTGTLEVRTGNGRYLRVVERTTPEHGTVALMVDITDDVMRQAEREAAAAANEAEMSAQADQRFLFELSDHLRGLHTEPDVRTASTTRIARHLGLARCQLCEIDLGSATMTVHGGFVDGLPALPRTVALSSGSPETIEALRAGEIVVNADTAVDHRTSARYEAEYGPLGLRSYVAVPVMVAGCPAAMLLAGVPMPRTWHAREISILQSVADRTWSRIAKVRLEQDREALLAELQELARTLESRVEERTADLEAAVAEREVLLQEVHHRVKNNLQVISSLINMQVRTHAAGPGQDALKECQTRVQAIALIHEKLYQGHNYAALRFSDYARSLALNVSRAVASASSPIALQFGLDELQLPVDLAIPCGLILNELLVNAFKHGFPGGRRGTITVNMTKLDDHRARLLVADDGQGLAEGRDIESGGSLGMRLVSTLTRQLGGQLEIVNRPGFTVTITFPIGADPDDAP